MKSMSFVALIILIVFSLQSCAFLGVHSGTPITKIKYPDKCLSTENNTAINSTVSPPALLALSGGGYRAMLFHVGALWRLNEIGFLGRLNRVSSVSGGSIVAGVLGANWSRLAFDDNGIATCFKPLVVEPIMGIANHTIDVSSILIGMFTPTTSASQLKNAYSDYLFDNLTLKDLPDKPHFIFNSTNLQTGAIWRFSKRYVGDGSIGIVEKPDLSLAAAIAASSAYPPLLSPLILDFNNEKWIDPPVSLTIFEGIAEDIEPVPKQQLKKYRRRVQLSDGGISDNLGLESLWNRYGELFVSDGGGGFSRNESPNENWLSQTLRVVGLIHGQPSQLRSKILLDRFRKLDPDGVFWSIQEPPATHIDVKTPDFPIQEIKKLAAIPTRLSKLDDCTQKRLINWGYVAMDSSLPYLDRLWKTSDWKLSSSKLPFPSAGFGSSSGKKECFSN